jgi:hypothetical protein
MKIGYNCGCYVYMQDLHVSLAYFGYYQGVLALVFALGRVLFGLIMHAFSQEKILRTASKIYIVSLITIGYITITNSFNPLFTIAFLFIISQIIPSNILVPICMNFIPHAKGKISAVLQGSQLIFSALKKLGFYVEFERKGFDKNSVFYFLPKYRAVVVKDVPPYAVVAGNPTKVVKLRFDEATIERLLNIAWWNWDIQKINKNLSLICSLDTDRLEEVSRQDK